NGFGGVIFHEACGHGLEATSVSKGTSVYTGKMGEKIASDLVTAIDDGTAENQWGSASIDDEGTPTRKNILIENGVLKNYLVDKLGGRRMDMEANGCSRRQSYKYEPTSRMSNTYIAPGQAYTQEPWAAGTGLDVLKKIDMVGNNLKMGQGMCGSVSGSIPANVGQPMVRVSALTVGGRKAGQ
ncbi:Metalloprotease TldD/PmbA like protein, partial [Aduncisulcus paluster]